MRVVSFALRSLLLIGGVAIVISLIAREALLIWAGAQLQTDLRSVRQALQDGDYAADCLNQDSIIIEGEKVVEAQLRFTSPTEYQLEVICTRFKLDPQVLKSAQLPPFVQKLPGSSGVTIGDAFSGVVIGIFGRQQVVYIENQAVKTNGDAKRIEVGDGPVSSCSGYGLQCCELETEIGAGQQVETAQDCPRSCHTTCIRRPVLLSLTADPFIDVHSRTVTLAGEQLLTVNYTIQPGATPDLTMTIDFGDGVVEQSTTATGVFTHNYTCASTSCQYSVQTTIVDSSGVAAADVPHGSFTVVVQ